MLTQQRKHFLTERLEQDGQLLAKPLSVELGVSEDTIRRDLREMAKAGLLTRVHGGALPASLAMGDLTQRQTIEPRQKEAIGRMAAQMVQPGHVVILDGGTTCAQVARHLPLTLQATVVTHCPAIAVALSGHVKIEVIMLGGRLYRHSMVGTGAATLEAISRVRADLYFMGVCSVHPTAGLTTGDYEEAVIKRALCHAAAQTMVLASAEKIETASPYVVVTLAEVTGLVVTRDVPDRLLAPYRQMGLQIHQAKV
ncbi:DeoR/GlpR family DNA-binding transcription regulator [Pseudomonas huanghezhanensis]|uniref:DeoR/GlpR family DNA-binding transcription regulator n=1 Tax=Pseudomonas huanghezhanensis TaxID=3002903 RepID=UPI002285496E|nr:DeoR/GlpR family DNA-binding transcription regulator [Pseudomonas sp. BSw22131]